MCMISISLELQNSYIVKTIETLKGVTICNKRYYFLCVRVRITSQKSHKNMTNIMDRNQIEEHHGSATTTLPQGTIIHKSTIYMPYIRNLISFNNIRKNYCKIHTSTDKNQKIIHILQNTLDGMQIKKILAIRDFICTL